MKRTVRLLAAPAAALLLLSACGGSADEAPEEKPASAAAPAEGEPVDEATGEDDEAAEGDAIEDGGESDTAEFDGETLTLDVDAVVNSSLPTTGKYFLEGATGVKAMATIDVEGPEKIEHMRELVGEGPVTYIKLDVDNRKGTEEIGIYEWFMYDAEGVEYEFNSLEGQAYIWDEEFDDDTDVDREVNDLAWEISSESANVGQRNEQWLVGPGDLPDEIAVMSATAGTFTDAFTPFPVK